ncbi:MAG: hypothetical protein V1696_03695 [Candidatus Jorgensenbacteria bacterium]
MKPFLFFGIPFRTFCAVALLSAVIIAIGIAFTNEHAYLAIAVIPNILMLTVFDLGKKETARTETLAEKFSAWLMVFSSVGMGVKEAIATDLISSTGNVLAYCIGSWAVGTFVGILISFPIRGIKQGFVWILGNPEGR